MNPDAAIRATVRVDPGDPRGTINRFVYGSNLEHLGRTVYRGLWAELLHNRKFAGVDPARHPRAEAWRGHFKDPVGFGVVEGWEPSNPVGYVGYTHDNTTFYSGVQSQRIDLGSADREFHGVAQPGIEVAGETDHRARLVLRIAGDIAAVHVALYDDAGENGAWEFTPNEARQRWHTFHGELRTRRAGENRLHIGARGQGKVWLGAVSLMPDEYADAGGIRTDVATLIRDGGISMIRWPGGNFASDYFWHEGIGPIDRRPTRLNRARPELEPHDLGTDEFLAFCRDYGIEPFIVLNAGSGSVAEAAAWVEYCNGPADSEWGRRRVENGHPEPWAVKYWSIGNEIWGNFQVGHVDAETYARRADETARAMRAVDPDIHITAIGHIRDTAGAWNRHVARAVSGSVDAIAIHHYPVIISAVDHPPPDDAMWAAITAGANDAAEVLSDSTAIIDAHWSGDTPPEISFDEWNSWVGVHGHPGWLDEPFRLRDGLYVAALFNEIHRRAERITMAHQAMIVNRLGFIEVRPTQTWTTASFQALSLYAEHCGTTALATDYAGPTFGTRAFGSAPPQEDVPALNVMATATTDGRRIIVAGVNLQAEDDIAARIEIAGTAIAATATVRELNGDDGMAYDTFENPGQTRVTGRAVDLSPENGAFDYVFPAHSATLIELIVSG